jgi:hypothetical protein
MKRIREKRTQKKKKNKSKKEKKRKRSKEKEKKEQENKKQEKEDRFVGAEEKKDNEKVNLKRKPELHPTNETTGALMGARG